MVRLVLSNHKTLTGEPGGSGHGHSTETVFVHIGRYSMPVGEMSQEEKSLSFHCKNFFLMKFEKYLLKNRVQDVINWLRFSEFYKKPLTYFRLSL